MTAVKTSNILVTKLKADFMSEPVLELQDPKPESFLNPEPYTLSLNPNSFLAIAAAPAPSGSKQPQTESSVVLGAPKPENSGP